MPPLLAAALRLALVLPELLALERLEALFDRLDAERERLEELELDFDREEPPLDERPLDDLLPERPEPLPFLLPPPL